MLGNRRPPPHIVFALSLLLGLLAGAAAVRYGLAENWLWTAVWGVVALWLLTDAGRAFGWMQAARRSAEQKGTQPPGPPRP
ncbi:hypothetical protein ACFP81_07625 [Deinococcus lacus]|uniref:DUF4175 domain-containing protein n=1 Tax=Deinococcus lacus TaxID=392561 RepID=A0ABW1YC73_9DEIO